MKDQRQGVCRLCGDYKKLSFEHIPPKKAFNENQRLFQTMQNLQDERKYSRFRKGLGKYSLCEGCNNHTGSWYGPAFVDWTKRGMKYLDVVQVDSALSIPFRIYPVRVLKQILVMAVAMIGEANVPYHSELRNFLLHRRSRYLSNKYRVHTYLTNDGLPRFASGMAIMKMGTSYSNYVVAEVSLPPLGYTITEVKKSRQSLASYKGLYDISWFTNYTYDECVPVYLRLPKLDTHSPMPLTYGAEETA